MKRAPMAIKARLLCGFPGFPAYFLLVCSILFLMAPSGSALEPGEPAPEFEMKGSDGKTYTLSKLRGEHGGIVLAFFPRAFTPG